MLWNKQTRRTLTILLMAVAVGVVCGAAALAKKPPRPPKPPETPPNPAIVYGDGVDIWVMDADGSNKTEVLRYAGSTLPLAPNWSPDGTQIVFNGRYAPLPHDVWPYGIYTVNLDGTEPTFLAPVENWWDNTGVVWPPVPTPDGQGKLLFVSRPVMDANGNGFTDLFLMDTDGTGLVNLTNTPDRSETGPTWAPDGCRFAAKGYQVYGNFSLIVCELGLDGQGNVVIASETNISDLARDAGKPLPSDLKWMAWANTQDKIAMTVPPEHDIWILDLETFDMEQLTGAGYGAEGGERHATWSPDDSKIAYWTSGGRGKDKAGIFAIDVATGVVTKLNRRGRHPDWWRNWAEQQIRRQFGRRLRRRGNRRLRSHRCFAAGNRGRCRGLLSAGGREEVFPGRRPKQQRHDKGGLLSERLIK